MQSYFNSHAHVERDEQYEGITGEKYEFQLTRSRGAWLDSFSFM